MPRPRSLRTALVRKLSTRPVRWWERNRFYPIKSKIAKLPPLPVCQGARFAVVVLSTPSAMVEAAWTARSLLLHLPREAGLVVVVDGSPKPDAVSQMQSMFPGCSVIQTSALVAEIKERAPFIVGLAEYHPMGRKLATILALQERYDVLFADNDVLAFKELPEILESIRNGVSRNLYLQEIGQVSGDAALFAPVHSLNLPYAGTINVGFLLIRQRSLALPVAEKILSLSGRIATWFPDTMILSVLMELAGALPLPRSDYVISAARQFWFEPDVNYAGIRLRHFTGPVRHLLYLKGMPFLHASWK